jgi:hypothetical protein
LPFLSSRLVFAIRNNARQIVQVVATRTQNAANGSYRRDDFTVEFRREARDQKRKLFPIKAHLCPAPHRAS